MNHVLIHNGSNDSIRILCIYDYDRIHDYGCYIAINHDSLDYRKFLLHV